MKRGILILVFVMTIYKIIGQPADDDELKIVKNNIYLELGGSGVLYSINYERTFIEKEILSLNGRFGISFFPGIFAIPITMHILVGKIRNFLDIGTGISLIRLESSRDFDPFIPLQTIIVGYRFQSIYNGIVFRIAYTPFIEWFNKPPVYHWGGLAIGYRF